MSRAISCYIVLLACAVSSGGVRAGELAQAVRVAGNAWHLELADVTGDGEAQVIYACYDGKVCCQDARSGALVWQHETGAFPYDLACADVNADGMAETFVASSDGGLYALD